MRRPSLLGFTIFSLLAWTAVFPASGGRALARDKPAASASGPATAPNRPAVNASASAAVPATVDAAAADAALEHGLDEERARNWSGAIEVYRAALKQWPSRIDLQRRLRLCEIHFKLKRRYTDSSFQRVLLPLSEEQAAELYNEVLERIEKSYVDEVPFAPLVRHGLDNLEVALRDPVFLKINVPRASASRLGEARAALRRRRAELVVADRAAAVAAARSCARLGREMLGLSAAPVLLEFTYGACDALDDFTSYLTPNKLEDLYAMIDGNFVGIGIELKIDKEGLRLIGVIRGGPAWEAGLKVGDLVLKVDGRALGGMGLDEAANRLQGAEGSAAELYVRRQAGDTRTFRIVRRHVEVESVVQPKIVDAAAGIGYLRLTGFQKTSTEEVDRAIDGLSQRGLKALVIDLRGNPGGLLNVAVDLAGRFIDSGLIVSTRGRARGQTQMLAASGQARWRMPLYVLVDRDSASASEILAGALQDHHRATIIGTRTYGKGSVQSIFSLRSAPAGLKLTTAKFYSPTDRPYSERGVEPDVPIVVHSAAKPNGETETERSRDEASMSDPGLDPVLAAAVRIAKDRDRELPQASR